MASTTFSKQRLDAPIIFGTEMVKALLAGRKTQTRRIKDTDSETIPCRFDVDKLWVRETWRKPLTDGHECYHYRATPEFYSCGRLAIDFNPAWKSPIFMPRCASRITLAVESVASQYLHDITPEDAIAEGIELAWNGTEFNSHKEFTAAGVANPQIQLQWRKYGKHKASVCDRTYSPIDSYRSLWESIHGTGTWNDNSQVWVIKFSITVKNND